MTETLNAVALRHVSFEDCGTMEAELVAAGYRVSYLDLGVDALDQAGDADLLIVLGGPISATDDDLFPFIREELDLLTERLRHDRPTLGICLGAQLIARALGARVHAGDGPEIGWGAVTLTDAGTAGPLRHLDGVPVLHWHGDTFEIPGGCSHLARSAAYPHQAFSRGRSVLALQFHLEASARGFERWLVGHSVELAAHGIDPRGLRADAAASGSRLAGPAARTMAEWLARLPRP